LHEVIVDGETGHLCNPHDVRCMARLILTLLGDESRRREMGRKARERAIRDFGRDRIVDQYIGVYRRLMEK
jgi:glycosyltransferase involved in cell wall biosynthesis